MRIPKLCIALALIGAGSVAGQTDYYLPDGGSADLPIVGFNDRVVNLQTSLFPTYYKMHSAERDQRWVRRNDSALAVFWQENSNLILTTLEQYSGIPWQESDFDIHVVRYYSSTGSSQPLIIPVGGIRDGVLIEASPVGTSLKLNLIYQLAHRNLVQAEMGAAEYPSPIADHPLMRPDPYGRDNLAMLLALVTAQEVMGLDSTFDAFQSAFWKKRFPGRQVLEEHLLPEWILSPDRPLAEWILAEPLNSRLVAAARPPRPTRPATQTVKRTFIEGLPLKGLLGFSVQVSGSGSLEIDKIDPFRLGYACGLQEGDIVRLVDNRRVLNHKQLVERIRDGMDAGGATLHIIRSDEPHTVVIRNLALPGADDEEFWEYFEDSTYYDEVTPDSTAGDSSGY